MSNVTFYLKFGPNLLKLCNYAQGWPEMCQPMHCFRVPIHCLSQAKSQVITNPFSILIGLASVLPFEYADSDWRVAIKLIFRNMVQESRYNPAHPTHLETGWQKLCNWVTVVTKRSWSSPKGRNIFCRLHTF